jgi:hypothetical protein
MNHKIAIDVGSGWSVQEMLLLTATLGSAVKKTPSRSLPALPSTVQW